MAEDSPGAWLRAVQYVTADQGAESEAAGALSETILDIRNLTIELQKSADRTSALADLNLTLRADEMTCLIGESGLGQVARRARRAGAASGAAGARNLVLSLHRKRQFSRSDRSMTIRTKWKGAVYRPVGATKPYQYESAAFD